MLILFDIDGTMLSTQRAGMLAMQQAARALFRPDFSFDGIEIAGRLDPLIWRDGARRNGIADPDAHHERFRAEYGRLLARRLRDEPSAAALPGVKALLAALSACPELTLGVLSGNYPETGRLKIECAGIDFALFAIGAWGCDGGGRRELPPVAMQRYRTHRRRAIDAGEVVVVGDTPHDIDCARHHGCRSLGVATGSFSQAQLHECGADLAVADLRDTAILVDWIRTPAVRRGAHAR
jgi:phosphoglycolate phosphatase-like HAD superfamily hydrolase